MLVIATNIAANTALTFLNRHSENQADSLARLSSGSRIVSASDDAAGLAVANRLQADITTLDQASRNALQGRAVLQTADGALDRIGDILQRLKSLTAQSISGAVNDTARGFIDAEYQQLVTEINEIGLQTQFNGTNLINGTFSPFVATFLIGVEGTDTIDVNLTNVDVQTNFLGFDGGFGPSLDSTGVGTAADATIAFTTVDTAIDQISGFRAEVGSYISRFEFRGEYIETARENLSAALSSIVDVDIAAEQTNLVNQQILTEAAISALRSANEASRSILRLLA